RSRDHYAQLVGVSGRLVQQAQTVYRQDRDLFEQVKAGQLTLNKALLKLKQAERYASIGEAPPLPAGLFDLIYADPPWQLGNPASPFSPEQHYLGCARRPATAASPTSSLAATAATKPAPSPPGSTANKRARSHAPATCLPGRVERMNAPMPNKNGKWGRVWRYQGPRGTVWRIRYQDASGRRVLETLGKEPAWNRQLAEKELRRRLVDVERDGYQKPQRLTFHAYTERWLEEYLPGRNLKLTTTDNYRQTLNRHLLPALGSIPLERLEREPQLLDHYITQKTRQGLSPKTITNHLLLLQVMLKTAVRWRLIRHNPVRDIDRPRLHHPEPQILDQAEIAALQAAYRERQERAPSPEEREWWRIAHTLTFTALGTGLRRGELLALSWADIKLLDHQLHVHQALVKGRLTTPKSRAGTRTIQLGPHTNKLLADHYAASRYTADSDYVFHHPHKGTPLDPARLSRRYLRPALKAAGINKPIRPFHDLRHTALTHDAAAGNPLTYIQHKAGHSQPAITQRYIHAAQTSFPGAAQRAEERMFSSPSR
ncbi:MAG: tyrosine-type recombinase/integrase, partial [Gaiellaceae bacterium]